MLELVCLFLGFFRVLGTGPCGNGNWALLCRVGKHLPLSFSPSPVAKEMRISKENGKGDLCGIPLCMP